MKFDKIEKKVYSILEEFNLNEIPIDIEVLAKKLGIQVRFQALEGNLSGVLYRDRENIIIGVNSYHPYTRQRYTIAHEIGHYILHNTNHLYVDRDFKVMFGNQRLSEMNNIEEFEANVFAFALLMPEKLVKKEFTKNLEDGLDVSIHDVQSIQELAECFKVSMQMLLIRLGQLL